MRRATVTETVWSVCEKDALTALTTAADANCPSYPHLTLPATAAATEEECQSLEKFSKQVLLSDIVLDSLDNDTDDRHRAVSIAKGQTDCAEMLLAALNTQPMTTVYEDWCMNCDTAEEVGTTVKLYSRGLQTYLVSDIKTSTLTSKEYGEQHDIDNGASALATI